MWFIGIWITLTVNTYVYKSLYKAYRVYSWQVVKIRVIYSKVKILWTMSWNKLSSVFVTFCPAESWSIKVWVCWPEWHAHTQSPLWDKLHLCSTFLKCLQMLYGKKVNCIKWWGRQSKAGKDKPREKKTLSLSKKISAFVFVHAHHKKHLATLKRSVAVHF